MTDNEIIKALECCINNGDCRECALNPKKGNYGYCTGLAIKSALDLINRQKAEIERLQSTVDSFTCIGKMYSEIKAEAYKEFAKILKEHKCSYDLDNYHSFEAVEINIIDEILREKAGDDDA